MLAGVVRNAGSFNSMFCFHSTRMRRFVLKLHEPHPTLKHRGVSVMEDEGTIGDHLSGVSATDGNWHHIAGEGASAACLHAFCISNPNIRSLSLLYLVHTCSHRILYVFCITALSHSRLVSSVVARTGAKVCARHS